MPIPMVNLVEFEHVVAVLDGIAGRPVVNGALRKAGITRKVLTAEPGFVPYAVEAAFLDAVARAVGAPHLGAQLGLAFEYPAYQSYARYLLGAPDLEAAIRRARRAQPLLHPGSDLVVRECGEHVVVGFEAGLGQAAGHRHIHEAAIPILTSAVRHFLGRDWTPVWIEMPGGDRANAASLEDLFGAPVRGGATVPALALYKSDLGIPNPMPPAPGEIVTLNDLPSLLGVRQPRTMEDVVTEALRTQLVLGDLSEEAVSGRLSIGRRSLQRLSIGRRSLQRVLRDEGTSFREIREKFVETRARILLAESQVSIAEIARSLGYCEVNSFRRAFQKWTNLTPTAYRSKFHVKPLPAPAPDQ
jgi:AraC-like DNA-binding protein